MNEISLEQELHANVRRTRITYAAIINGQKVAIKCFRKPLYGVFHWQRAQVKGRKIRQANGPVPDVVFSGWVPELKCFGFATEFLEGYRSMRVALRDSGDAQEKKRLLTKLAETIADLHQKGIKQPDGNLTNFLLGPEGDIKMVDEDDVRVFRRPIAGEEAVSNLANVGARLPSGDLPTLLRSAYLNFRRKLSTDFELDEHNYEREVFQQKEQFRIKREARDAAPEREFD